MPWLLSRTYNNRRKMNFTLISTVRKYRVYEYDMIVGAYFQSGNHWDLLVIEPKKKVLYFYNPFGETAFQQRHMLQNWKNFLGRTLNDNKNWRLDVPVHSKQTDGFNCGMCIVMFAENLILGLPCIFEKKDVLSKRKEIAATLLLYEVNVKECCPACGWKPEGEEKLMRCGMCECYFHKKPHCVGEALHSAGSDTFICKRCEYNVE